MNKKILIALTSLCAEGTPVLVLEMCRWWLSQDIELQIITLNAEPKDLEPEFRELGIPVECLNLSHKGYIRYWQIFQNFYRISRRFQPDALLSMPLGWHTFMACGAKLTGVKQIAAHVGNYPVATDSNAFAKFRLLVQLGRTFTEQLICCSDYVREGTIKYFGVKTEEIITIYNGCPLEQIAKRASLSRQQKADDSLIIGMVARLEIHKDQPTLIKAARILKQKGIKFIVQLIGEGSRRQEYEALIRSEGVEDCVMLLGMRRDIPELLGQMDIFVFSAKPDEGLGIALLEAMAAEVAVVATDVGACREVLDDGKLGTLVSPQNPQRMVEAIEQLANNLETTKQVAEKAKSKVLQEFTVAKMAQQYSHCLGLS